MSVSRTYLLVAPTIVGLGVVAALFVGPSDLASSTFAMLLCCGVAAIAVLLQQEGLQSAGRLRFLVDILWGSLLVGGLYAMMVVIRPSPSHANLAWMFGIPVIVAVLQQRQWPGIMRALPLLVGGLMSAFIFVLMFRVPLD